MTLPPVCGAGVWPGLVLSEGLATAQRVDGGKREPAWPTGAPAQLPQAHLSAGRLALLPPDTGDTPTFSQSTGGTWGNRRKEVSSPAGKARGEKTAAMFSSQQP